MLSLSYVFCHIPLFWKIDSVYVKECVINESVRERNSWWRRKMAKALNNLPSLALFIVEESVTANFSKKINKQKKLGRMVTII